MVTARDVADRAGTSNAVVSYVFNNGPRNVSPGTRDRVLRAAAELGYRPNALARALSFGRTASIGLLVPDIANPFFGELARALEDSATARNHSLLIGDAALDPDRERRSIATFIDRRVDSMVMVSLLDEPDLSALGSARIPVVALHPVTGSSEASSLTIDYKAAAGEAVRHLISHGYTSVGILNGPTGSIGARQHDAGYRDALASAPQLVRPAERASAISRSDAAAVAHEWLGQKDRPRAIYASTDEQAYGVLFAAYQLGIRVPDDLAVFGFDDTSHSAFAIPPLSTVKQPITDIASRAIELLTGDRDLLPVHELASHSLILRESCGC